MAKRAFGELEMAILQILKSADRMTVKQVLARLGGENKYTTVMTVMNRLATKKVLKRERMGLQYEYWVAPAQPKALSFVDQLKQKVFGMKLSAVVSHLVETADEISEEELREMEQALERARAKRRPQ
jgi:predicted transcriptional regulator